MLFSLWKVLCFLSDDVFMQNRSGSSLWGLPLGPVNLKEIVTSFKNSCILQWVLGGVSDRRARNQERPVGDTPEHSWVSLKSSLSSGPFIRWNLPSLVQDSLDNAKWMLFLTTEGLVQPAPGEPVSPSLQWWEPRLIGLGCRKGLEQWFSPGGGHVGIPWEGEAFSSPLHAIPYFQRELGSCCEFPRSAFNRKSKTMPFQRGINPLCGKISDLCVSNHTAGVALLWTNSLFSNL